MSLAKAVNLMLSSGHIHRCTAKETSRAGECAAHAHLCAVCWQSIRAHLATRVAFDSAAQRDALLVAGDRFVADLAALEAPVELHAAPDFAWFQVRGDQPTTAADAPAGKATPLAATTTTTTTTVDMPLFSNCAACGKALTRGVVINAMGKSFHSACFACRQCGKALQDDSAAFFDDGAGFPWCGCVSASQ